MDVVGLVMVVFGVGVVGMVVLVIQSSAVMLVHTPLTPESAHYDFSQSPQLQALETPH